MKTEDVIVKKTLTIERFSGEIDALVKRHSLDYIDAVVHYCTLNGIEIETVASLIKSNAKIKSRIQIEAEKLSFLQKNARLPL